MSVITRWRTQYNLIKSLIRSKDALKAYAVDTQSSLIKDKIDLCVLLLDRRFWTDIEELEEVPCSNHEAQFSSENDTVHLGHVTKRWLGVKEALVTMHQGGASSLYDVIQPDGIWAEVYKKQTTDIHWVAYYLDPASAGAIGHSDHIQQAVFSFMRRYIPVDDLEWHQVINNFWDFQSKQEQFPLNEPNGIWRDVIIHKPRVFWQYCRAKSLHLAGFAIRIFSIPAFLVPSERVFSSMNFILDKFRASMKVERSNKAVYIYMNQRAL